MPIVHNPAGEYAKELRKWEQHHTQFAITEDGESKPGRPYAYRPYPKMLYRAQVHRNGQALVEAPQVSPFGWRDAAEHAQAELAATAFTEGCRMTVGSEDEHRRARDNGWRDSPSEALAFHEGLQRDIANAAAEANHAAQRMTPTAQAERKKRESATDKHVPE